MIRSTCLAASLCALLASQPVQAQSPRALHLHRQGYGSLEGMRLEIGVTIEACRAAKKLPLDAARNLPPDSVLEKLALVEVQQYFDGVRRAVFKTFRQVAADPSSPTCDLAIFHERSSWAGVTCAEGTGGQSTPLSKLLDYESPGRAEVRVSPAPSAMDGCHRAATPYDIEGLPQDQAGGHACVWYADIMAKTMRAAGLPAKGHDPQSPAPDYCLYARVPAVVVGGHREMVVLKTAANTSKSKLNQLLGVMNAYHNQSLVRFSDGAPVPANTFSASAVRQFLEQPVKTPVQTQ